MFFFTLVYLLFVTPGYCQSCNTSADDGFGIGTRTLPPAANVSTAPPTGPYRVGVTFETYCFQDRGLTLSFWYPATPEETASPYVSTGGIVGKAVQDAPIDPAGGPYPLILFSSGLAAVNDAYYFYLQNLASNGYVVVSTQHLDARNANTTSVPAYSALAALDAAAGNTNDAVVELYTEWFRETQFALTYRPQEIEFAIDQALAENNDPSSRFHRTIDADKIGMTGHSLGGFYTNVVGGGMPLYCDYIMRPDQLNPNNGILADVSPCAFSTCQGLPSPSALHDSRIKAIVGLAAPSFLTKTQIARSAAPIIIPNMILTGDNFTSETTAWIQRAIYDNTAGPSHWVKVAKTNHYLVADSYLLNPVLSANMGAADKENFLDKAAVYMTYSAAFFNYYLKGNGSNYAILTEKSSSFVKELEFRNFDGGS
ncbi:alpha/beta-hydrolase [Camillea tinctor]|nr:alpha/beta-hydrolase [Camillea tinctor]